MTKHYTTQVPSAEGGHWPPQELGFDLADVSSVSKLNGMPQGVMGLVYLGLKNGVDNAFKDAIQRWRTNERVWGYYIVDEPIGVDPKSIKAQADYIHANHPGAIAYCKLTNQKGTDKPEWGPYSIESTGCDLLGIGGYSVRARFPGGYDKGLIERYVSTAVRDGIPLEKICPYCQCFGGVTDWPLPTQAQMDEMFAHWRRLVPNPVMDCMYAWAIQPQWGTQGLSNNEMLREAVRRHFKAQQEGPSPAGLNLSLAVDGEALASFTLRKGQSLTLTAT